MKCSDIHYPASATWEVNTACNHRCIYCYNYRAVQAEPETATADKYADIAAFIIAHKPLTVSISGGEPLIAFAQLVEPMTRLAEAGILLTLYTNATLVTKEIAAFLAKYYIRVMVSFPSVVEEEYRSIVCSSTTYEAAIAAMKMLTDYGVILQPNIVINRINYKSVEKTVTFLAQSFSPRTIFISRTTKPSNAGADYDEIQLTREEINQVYNRCIELGEKYGIRMRSCGGCAPCALDAEATRRAFGKVCDGGINGYTVTENGDVRLCSRDTAVYGNIFHNSFSEIRKMMDIWLAQPIPEECSACAQHLTCRGGCRMAAGKTQNPPVPLDCDADVSLAFAKRSRKKPLNPFKRYTLREIIAQRDVTAVRLSYLAQFFYAEEKVAAFLLAHKSFSLIKLCLCCGISYWEAVALINRLLTRKMLQESQ